MPYILSAVTRIRSPSSSAETVGCALFTKAAIPETIGAANEVPPPTATVPLFLFNVLYPRAGATIST